MGVKLSEIQSYWDGPVWKIDNSRVEKQLTDELKWRDCKHSRQRKYSEAFQQRGITSACWTLIVSSGQFPLLWGNQNLWSSFHDCALHTVESLPEPWWGVSKMHSKIFSLSYPDKDVYCTDLNIGNICTKIDLVRMWHSSIVFCSLLWFPELTCSSNLFLRLYIAA